MKKLFGKNRGGGSDPTPPGGGGLRCEGKKSKDLKNERIVPIHKSRSRGKPENYRPVSITSHVYKVVERIIKSRMSHLQDNNLLTRHQHGFINKKSCQSNLLEALEYWTEAMDKRQGLDILYLDL